jgi:hypothetical protein
MAHAVVQNSLHMRYLLGKAMLRYLTQELFSISGLILQAGRFSVDVARSTVLSFAVEARYYKLHCHFSGQFSTVIFEDVKWDNRSMEREKMVLSPKTCSWQLC